MDVRVLSAVRTPICLGLRIVTIRYDMPSRSDDENFPSGPSTVYRSLELLQLASFWTFQQHVRTTLSARQASGFLSKAQL